VQRQIDAALVGAEGTAALMNTKADLHALIDARFGFGLFPPSNRPP
jgi:hypothetical protein